MTPWFSFYMTPVGLLQRVGSWMISEILRSGNYGKSHCKSCIIARKMRKPVSNPGHRNSSRASPTYKPI